MAIINPTADQQPEPESTTQERLTNALDSQTPQQEQPTTTTITSIESDPQSTTTTTTKSTTTTATKEEPDLLTQNPEPDMKPTAEKWPGWPGYNVFRFIVPRRKAGRIIESKGDFIEKLCKDTRAKVQVLDAPSSITDRVELISGKEEPEAPLSPAMDAAIRIFKRVSRLSEGDAKVSAAAEFRFCSSIWLLVPSTQATSLTGKQGSILKSIQENTKATVRIMSKGPSSRDLGDKSALHANSQGIGDHYLEKGEPLFLDRETPMESQIKPTHPSIRSSATSPAVVPMITQIRQTMRVPISYAKEIIGVRGANLASICKSSGATISVKERVELSDQRIVELNGTSLQRQTA